MNNIFIKDIEPIHYSQYKNISSNEKLATYACYYLYKNNIPLTFSYICMASFKLFPEKFYFDEEFKEFPHIEKLNRTILHLVTNKTSKSLTGSAREGYQLTKSGITQAKQIEADIINKKVDVTVENIKIVDMHKKGIVQDYTRLNSSEYFINFNPDVSEFQLDFLWNYFKIIPFTQISMIKSHFNNLLSYSESIEDLKTIRFVNSCLKKLNNF
jgi:hypothetical protein